MKKPKPRTVYNFHLMDTYTPMKIAIPEGKDIVAVRARCAVYAYARRNGGEFYTRLEVSKRGKKYLMIHLVG